MSFKDLLALKKTDHAPDKKLILVSGTLIVFGLVLLFSASLVAGYLRSGNSLYFINHQLLGLLLGTPAIIICSRIDYHIWRKYALYFLLGSIVLLLLVFVPGLSANYGKAHNWINIFGFSLQPSEFVKIFFLLYLAAWLEVKQNKLEDFSHGMGPFMAILGIIGFLMLLQPDLGTLSIIFASSVIVYFVAGGRFKHIIVPLLLATICLVALVNIKSNKMDRIECYWHPEISADDKCYQTNQALIAIGSGGFWGRGLGESRQKFMYLPEVWSDSIFAVVAEELGFVGSIFLLALYFFLFYRGWAIAQKAPDLYGRILAIGIVSWILIQTILNVGGTINFIPMTGVPLPFVSSGGSSLLAVMAAVGILLNISRQTRVVSRKM
ncbi:putative lipid II flippase FtsW [Candidatus Falkowbacteria bacterium CG10_big_fil_rev_8_21_14_0_10_39_9]|uniref:Probable peptidoglycan glycosyltransferase FtsW n=1 Tax=Candidatus Falkowbacteria bacterium CG10_big_fil_rev_8_21_14_0_10_39_9 TaxID=1974566 RepID=A0A2M6WQ25_9BACT|nr:MAG: putative lipid II flippase FtsW [Candidatus Falkowbacteria bacterium CG10_big_fil_rev_8_21_14_0_10_39_9]